jgi:mediator of RNA polymerase II transcription subunit 20
LLKFIEKGYQYSLGDFMVKIGSVILGQTTKGIVIEVEYLPCVIPNRCNDLLEEFIGNLTFIAVLIFR